MPRGPEPAVMPRPRASRWAVLPSLWEAECWTSLTALTYSCSTSPSLIVVKYRHTDKIYKRERCVWIATWTAFKTLRIKQVLHLRYPILSPRVDCQVKAGQGTSAEREPKREGGKTTQSLNLWNKLEQQWTIGALLMKLNAHWVLSFIVMYQPVPQGLGNDTTPVKPVDHVALTVVVCATRCQQSYKSLTLSGSNLSNFCPSGTAPTPYSFSSFSYLLSSLYLLHFFFFFFPPECTSHNSGS